MAFEIHYFHDRVYAEVQSWPVDVLADYARFELRPWGRTGIGRAFYCFLLGKKVVVLHAFIKKSQQTPDSELKMARKRLKEVKNG